MNTGAVVILVGGVGLAAFLYIRSQQQQAAALAAAQAAPGPGLVTKLENTVKKIGGSAAKAVEQVPVAGFRLATGFASGIAGGASGVVGFVKGLF